MSSPEITCTCMSSVADSREDLGAELAFTVAEGDLAIALGSGDVPVLATPRLVAWAEHSCVVATKSALAQTCTSVGTRIDLRHKMTSLTGETIRVRARVAEISGNRISYSVEAVNESGTVIASGIITRAHVNRATFLKNAGLNSEIHAD